MSRIDGPGSSPITPQPQVEAHIAQQAGEYKGLTVTTQPDQTSLVQDSQEEAGAMFQEKASKSLSKRSARSRSASRIREIMQKYMKSVGGVGHAERFEKLADSLKNLSNATPEEIREKIEEFKQQGDDENIESALLLALEELFVSEGGNDELVAAIRDVKAAVGEELRDFYEQQIKSYDGVSDVYDQLLGEYGEQDFLKATEAMIKRLGDDLQSQGTTVDKNQVKSIVDSLYHLEVSRNTYMAFAKLMDKLDTVFND